ncbi:MAG: hypothetical protein JO359_09875 [Candidatus Eremiobacteraeota bacterium]|nr:hypothetical protein [Candidatus Eremiobacteraeota bacterium]
MNKIIRFAAIAAVLSAAPLAAFAQEAPQNVQSAVAAEAGQRFELIDPSTGRVIGELVSVGNKSLAIRSMAERARAVELQPAPAPDTKWHPRQQESKAFWDAFNANFITTP